MPQWVQALLAFIGLAVVSLICGKARADWERAQRDFDNIICNRKKDRT